MPTLENDPLISRTNMDIERFSGGVYGESTRFNGVRGITYAEGHGAVVGVSENHTSAAGPGVFGQSDGTGVWGTSKTWMGVFGHSESTTGGAGVMGEAQGAGVIGKSHTWIGVYGESFSTTGGGAVVGEHKANGSGVVGLSGGGVGVWGKSETHEGVHAETRSPVTAAVAAYNLNAAGTGAAVYARKEGTVGHAGFFDGQVWVSGDLGVGGDIRLANADCAEDFDVEPRCDAEAGSVVSIGENGAISTATQAYDTRVAGVVSGAGAYKPGLILDSRGGVARRPVALMGKVYCKVDASFAPIAIGDLLTTSSTPGHAMKAVDRAQAFGATVGKALAPLQSGRGLIPILVALT